MPKPHRAHLHAVVLAGVGALVASVLAAPAQAAPPAAESVRVATAASALSATARSALAKQSTSPTARGFHRQERAMKALSRARRALSTTTPAAERPDATLALRTLWEFKDALPKSQLKLANALARRPDKPVDVGDANIKIHYDPAELTAYSINDAVSTLTYVGDTYAAAGYRRPKPDGTKGGDGRIDVYLDQLPPGLYGYCTTDQKRTVKPGRYDTWSYCVIDNDFAGFPQHTPLQNLQVTAAHEYFHAVQFGYDVREDKWMLEATATWAEDELYDDINDNAQYLDASPLVKPGQSMDSSADNFSFYGVWTFFRYMTEQYPAKVGPLPGIILHIWDYADSSKGARKNKYSTQAINKALRKYAGTSLTDLFARYSAANRNPAAFYAEGAELHYPAKPLKGDAALGQKKKKTFKAKLNHLTSSSYRFTPNGTAPGSRLKLRFRLGAKKASPRAVVVSYGAAGNLLGFDVVKPNKRGLAKAKVDFATGAVGSVEVTLVNASTRFRSCFSESTSFSCRGGEPVDQKRLQMVRAKVS